MARISTSLCRGLLSLVVPTSCPACGARVDREGSLCRSCHKEVRLLRKAAAELPSAPDLAAPLSFEGVARTLVHRMKYQGDPIAALWLARLMERSLDRLLADSAAAVLQPVPLHPVRLRERGFNQAERLARLLARRRGLHVRTDLLQRVRWSGPLPSLDREERRRAVEEAFRPRRAIDPETAVILIDDVWTTGATLASCRAALRSGGFEGHISFLVAARTVEQGARLPD